MTRNFGDWKTKVHGTGSGEAPRLHVVVMEAAACPRQHVVSLLKESYDLCLGYTILETLPVRPASQGHTSPISDVEARIVVRYSSLHPGYFGPFLLIQPRQGGWVLSLQNSAKYIVVMALSHWSPSLNLHSQTSGKPETKKKNFCF